GRGEVLLDLFPAPGKAGIGTDGPRYGSGRLENPPRPTPLLADRAPGRSPSARRRRGAAQPRSLATRSMYCCFASSWPVPLSLAQASYLAVPTKSKKPGLSPLTSPSAPCLYSAYRRRSVSLSGRSDSPWTSCLACSKLACRSDIGELPEDARMTARGGKRVNR